MRDDGHREVERKRGKGVMSVREREREEGVCDNGQRECV